MYPMWQRNHDTIPECLPVPGSRYKQPSTDRVALFHYVTRSREDFAYKQQRGGGQNKDAKPWSYFEHIKECAFCSTLGRCILYFCGLLCICGRVERNI
jgi:hypothetical protein